METKLDGAGAVWAAGKGPSLRRVARMGCAVAGACAVAAACAGGDRPDADLDAVDEGRPVWLMHTMGHYGVANSVALELAGITADTPDPPGGTIDRDAAGRPTGVLKESAMGLVTRLIPRLGREEQREGIRRLADAFNAECMTGAKEPGIVQATWTFSPTAT